MTPSTPVMAAREDLKIDIRRRRLEEDLDARPDQPDRLEDDEHRDGQRRRRVGEIGAGARRRGWRPRPRGRMPRRRTSAAMWTNAARMLRSRSRVAQDTDAASPFTTTAAPATAAQRGAVHRLGVGQAVDRQGDDRCRHQRQGHRVEQRGEDRGPVVAEGALRADGAGPPSGAASSAAARPATSVRLCPASASRAEAWPSRSRR